MKRRIAMALLVCVVLALLAGLILRQHKEPEPVYQGRKLSVWLEIYDPTNTVRLPPQLQEAQTAIRQMGTNAIPTLLVMLRTRESSPKYKLLKLAQKQHVIKIPYVPPSSLYERAAMALQILGRQADGTVPDLIKILDGNPSPAAQASIARVLG